MFIKGTHNCSHCEIHGSMVMPTEVHVVKYYREALQEWLSIIWRMSGKPMGRLFAPGVKMGHYREATHISKFAGRAQGCLQEWLPRVVIRDRLLTNSSR